jgi:hypothetical protein
MPEVMCLLAAGGEIPISLYSEGDIPVLMSWMEDKKKISEEERKKLEKGSGCVKAWTLGCNWIYRFINW